MYLVDETNPKSVTRFHILLSAMLPTLLSAWGPTPSASPCMLLILDYLTTKRHYEPDTIGYNQYIFLFLLLPRNTVELRSSLLPRDVGQVTRVNEDIRHSSDKSIRQLLSRRRV